MRDAGIDTEIAKELDRACTVRETAGYFEAGSNKGKDAQENQHLTEQNVLEEFINALHARNELWIRRPYERTPSENGNEPTPDFLVPDAENRQLGIEIAEIIDGDVQAINESRRKERADDQWRRWSPQKTRNNSELMPLNRVWEETDLIKAIQERLVDKDHNKKWRPCDEKIVLLYSSEEDISYDECEKALREKIFSGFQQIDKAYLLLARDERGYCPYILLNIEKNRAHP